MNIGKSIKYALVEKGAKQKDLALAICFSENHVSQMVKGNGAPSVKFILACCDFFEMATSEFIALGEE